MNSLSLLFLMMQGAAADGFCITAPSGGDSIKIPVLNVPVRMPIAIFAESTFNGDAAVDTATLSIKEVDLNGSGGEEVVPIELGITEKTGSKSFTISAAAVRFAEKGDSYRYEVSVQYDDSKLNEPSTGMVIGIGRSCKLQN